MKARKAGTSKNSIKKGEKQVEKKADEAEGKERRKKEGRRVERRLDTNVGEKKNFISIIIY